MLGLCERLVKLSIVTVVTRRGLTIYISRASVSHMKKHRICVCWTARDLRFMERGFRVPYDDSWHAMVRAFQIKAASEGDRVSPVRVYSTSIDGKDTEGYWTWSDKKSKYIYHELG